MAALATAEPDQKHPSSTITNDLRPAQKLRQSLNTTMMLPNVGEYFGRVTATTLEWTYWLEQDEWRKRFGRKVKISDSVENQPYLDIYGQLDELDRFSEVSTFVEPDPTSQRWKRRATYIEGFCTGGSFILDNSIPCDPRYSQVTDGQEPTAWVSDRNRVLDTAPRKHYDRVLNVIEFFEVLQKKRFPDSTWDDRVGHRRRIFINNPNGTSILALIRTVPGSEVDGFRELFANYVTTAPSPNFVLRESTEWNGGFVISFNIPFCAISTKGRQDVRMMSNGKKQLRRRYDLSFLNLRNNGSDGEDEAFQAEAFLHEAVCSLVVTGLSERYWTAACLEDDFFDDEPRLVPQDEIEELVGSTDPIILQPESGATESPRAYALAALATTLRKVADHHANIRDWYEASLNLHISSLRHGSPTNTTPSRQWRNEFQGTLDWVIYSTSRLVTKLDEFFARDLMISPEGLPQSPLWQSVQAVDGAMKSLRSIMISRNDLRDICCELEQFVKTCDEARRARKNEHAEEQENHARKVQRFTIAALILTILNLVVQLYSGRPEKGDPSAWPGFIILAVVTVIISVGTSVYLLWTLVSGIFERLPGQLSRGGWIVRGYFVALGNFVATPFRLAVRLWNQIKRSNPG